ncbi:hypothetical protein [Methanocella sp. MCL-LM]
MKNIVNTLLLAINGGMTNEELAEIQAMSVRQQTHVEELRARIKTALVD